MKDNRIKEQILKDIREALMNKDTTAESETMPCESPHAGPVSDEDISVCFAQNFTARGGTMYYCYNETDIRDRLLEIQQRHGGVTIGCASDNLSSFLGHLGIEDHAICSPDMHYPLGATLCEALIAWQGALVISSNQGLGVTQPALAETTVVLAFTSQVVADWESANERLKNLYPQFPECLMVTNPGSYAYRKGQQKMYLILIEDED